METLGIVRAHDGRAIDRDTPIPFYYQLQELLRARIENGQWQTEQPIPSERELCTIFQVSRTTARQALDGLVNEGVLYRVKGKGTFVAKPKLDEHFFQTSAGFYEEMSARGLKVETRVLSQRLVKAPKRAVDALGLAEDTDMVRIDRVRLVNGEPICLVTNWIPAQLCPDLLEEDLGAGSLYSLLRDKYGLVVGKGRRTIQAVPADDRDVQFLGVRKEAPMLLLQSVSYLEDGTPLEYFEAHHRGDRSKFEVMMVPSHRAEAVLSPRV